jgi:hypothetical protein
MSHTFYRVLHSSNTCTECFFPGHSGVKKHSVDMNLYRVFVPRHSVPKKHSVYIYVYRVFYFTDTRYNVTLGTNRIDFFGQMAVKIFVRHGSKSIKVCPSFINF